MCVCVSRIAASAHHCLKTYIAIYDINLQALFSAALLNELYDIMQSTVIA